MNKKAVELTMQAVIVGVLLLVVLVILIMVFRTEIQKLAGKYSEIGDQASTDRCASILSGTRKCAAQQPSETTGTGATAKTITYSLVSRPASGKWSDCKDNEDCWEKAGG